jgi:hypothetical protein
MRSRHCSFLAEVTLGPSQLGWATADVRAAVPSSHLMEATAKPEMTNGASGNVGDADSLARVMRTEGRQISDTRSKSSRQSGALPGDNDYQRTIPGIALTW